MSPKTKTFRIRRVPANATRQSLVQLLQECLTDLGGEQEIHIRSLVSSPDDWASPPSQTATVEFDAVPELLQDGTRTTWTVPVPGTNTPLTFDTHFLGFTPLNAVDKRHHEYDCIAVSGLASHPFGSWRHRGVPGQSQFMWLRDQLPEDFPAVRCMIYGYDTKLVDSDSFQSIDDLARSFIAHLKTIGRADYSARPLIMLGHSLGGVIVKRALSYLATAGEADVAMLAKIKLFIGFGVPNRGMRIDYLLMIVGSRPNRDLIETLSEKPANVPSWLSLLDENFAGIAQHRGIRIVSAYETEQTPLAEMQSTGEASKTGASEVLVRREPAIQIGSRNLQDIFHINKDHSNMVKFERNDINYFVVRNFLREAAGSPGEMKTQSTTEVGTPLEGSGTKANERPLRRNDHEDHRILLSTLGFEEQDYRLGAIEQAHESTFGWIFEKAELRFIPWIMKGSGVYWIRGKPGSGKSTLMKYLHDSKHFSEALNTRGLGRRQVDLWFFFNERGTYLQKSLDGLLRTLLAKLVSKHRATAELVLDLYYSRPREARDRWRFEDLKDAFATILSQKAFDLDLTIFLDALDEYYGFPEVISHWILDVISASRCPDSSASEGQWASSRQLSSPEVVNLLVSRAEGVFLWVKLAVNEIASSRPISSQRDLEALISRLPADLEEFYMRTLSRIPNHYRSRAYTLLEIVSRSSDVLTVEDVFYASACALGNTFQECEEHLRNAQAHFQQDSGEHEEPSRDLLNLCGGLLECVHVSLGKDSLTWHSHYKSQKTIVQFIHRTVRDFVASPLFPQAILGSGYQLQSDNGYTFLMKYYCVLAKQQDWENPSDELLFLAYHDESSTGRPATAFIDSLPDAFFDTSEPTFKATFMADYYTSPFIFAVLANLQLYFRECLGVFEASQARCSRSYPLNKLAWLITRRLFKAYNYSLIGRPETDMSKMAQLLLQHGFGIDEEYFGLTPFETLFCDLEGMKGRNWGLDMTNLARVFIRDGQQNPNARLRMRNAIHVGPRRKKRDIKGFSALHNSFGKMTQMLLENGADPNVQDLKGGTPLDVCVDAAWLYDEFESFNTLKDVFETMMLLLSHGGKFTRRGKKILPAFLKEMHEAGYHFPDALVEQEPLDVDVSMPLKGKIRRIFSRRSG